MLMERREQKRDIETGRDMILLRRWRDLKWYSISTTVFMYERKNDV